MSEKTLFMKAVSNNNLNLVKLLLDSRPDTLLRDWFNKDILSCSETKEMDQLLIQHIEQKTIELREKRKEWKKILAEYKRTLKIPDETKKGLN